MRSPTFFRPRPHPRGSHSARAGLLLLLAGAATAGVACGDGGRGPTTPNPDPPASRCAVRAVSVTPAQGSLRVGGTMQLSASVTQTGCGDATPVWSTSDAAVLRVSAEGTLTAVAPGGPVTISARVGAVSGSATFAVEAAPAPVASVTVAPAGPLALAVGQTVQLTATARDAGGTALTGRTTTWTTSNAAAVQVAGDGRATAVGGGQATITATIEGATGSVGVTATAAPVPVASVAVSPATATLAVGQTAQLTATARDAAGAPLAGRGVTWATSNASVATVSSAGLVTAVGAGQVTVMATSEGQSGSAAVTVTAAAPAPVASLSVTPAAVTLAVGQSAQLAATPRDAAGAPLTGRAVSWTTSNAAVATVTGAGLVSAVAAGQATITAASEGRTATASVTVSAPTPPPARQVTLEIDNRLIYAVNISVAGAVIGSVPAQSTRSATVTAAASLRVSFDLVRPSLGGRALGDPMSGYWDLTAPTGTVNLTVDNVVGGQAYFAPVVTNTSGRALLMAANWGLQAENRCNCTVPPTGTPTQFGYYRLYSNSTLVAFRDGTNYTGSYRQFSNFSGSVGRGSGQTSFTFSTAP